jgi:hypothetical protein
MLRLLTATLVMTNALAFAPTPGKTSTGTSKNIATSLPLDIPAANTLIQLDSRDQWIQNLDYQGFANEVSALGKELQKNAGQADVDHLKKIVGWRNIAAILGVATMWLPPNPM